MRKVSGLQFALFMLTISILFSCAKSSPIGSDLLSGDQANIQFTDTITMQMATIKEDTVKAYEPASPTNTPFNFYPFGNFIDPVFGTVNASVFGQLRASTSITADLSGAVLDSAILSLVYNTDDFYGDYEELQTVSVYRLTEDMDATISYFSNQTFEFDPMPLATVQFTPSKDSVNITEPSDTIPTISAPKLRISLDQMFGADLLAEIQSIYGDTTLTNIEKETAFLDYFKGLHITSDVQTNGMLNFFLSSGASALKLYYTSSDGDKSSVSFAFNSISAKMTHLDQTFSPEIEMAFDDYSIGDTLLYLQALSGPNIEMKFPYADRLSNIIVNKAELEFTISTENDDDFPSPQQIMVTIRDDDGTYLFIEDVIFALNRSNITTFGGQVVDASSGGGLQSYKMNISAIFQDKVDGINDEPLYIRVFPKQEQSSRVKLYGPGHPQYPAKLNLTYTRL